ncbi:replication-relaxation family protein [Catellatospora sp. NPDC049609]|uniref:replication-relaxation family protein n=1 Tax=Catellatospora sp. NPDC049609 TaxID=3155505 RepID=UPI00342909B0
MSDGPETRLPSSGDTFRPGRTPRPSPGAGRRATPQRNPTLLDLSNRLTPRDYTIAHLLTEHTALTTPQLTAALFGSPVTCQHRLHALRRMRFIDRFIRNEPRRPRPVCWVPGVLSARYVAMARGEHPPSVRTVHERAERTVASATLPHLLGVNGFFTALLAAARKDRGLRLARWWSERTATAAYGRRIQPDGHGVWVDGSASVGFFLEYDTGSETLARIVDKLSSYQRLLAAGGPDYPVLYVLQNPRREEHLHQRLSAGVPPGVAVASTNVLLGDDPAAAVWRLWPGGSRRRLADLPSSHGEPGPINPGGPAAEDDPLWLLRGI